LEPLKFPEPHQSWGAYYGPIVNTFRTYGGRGISPEGANVSIEEADLSIEMHPAVAAALLHEQWEEARQLARERHGEFVSDGYQADGLRVNAGRTWLERLEPGRPLSEI
jgi:hypothetical protein